MTIPADTFEHWADQGGLAGLADQINDDEFIGSVGNTRQEADPIVLGPEGDIPGIDDDEIGEPDASVITGGKASRPRGAATYERKLRRVFAFAIKLTAQRPSTAPDSAALILMSPKVAQTVGELAATEPRIARGIDMLFEGTDSPYLNAIIAIMPLTAQIARNHEPILEPKSRGIKIPILNRHIGLPFKIGLRLPWLRNVTSEPSSLADHVFGHPAVQEVFRKQQVPIGWRAR